MSSNKDKSFIAIDVSNQVLRLTSSSLTRDYLISTSKKGVGQENNSGKTPLGKHYIYKKIGQHMPVNSVFLEGDLILKYIMKRLGISVRIGFLQEYSGWLELKRELTLAEKWIQKIDTSIYMVPPTKNNWENPSPQAASECQTRTLLNCLTMFK